MEVKVLGRQDLRILGFWINVGLLRIITRTSGIDFFEKIPLVLIVLKAWLVTTMEGVVELFVPKSLLILFEML